MASAGSSEIDSGRTLISTSDPAARAPTEQGASSPVERRTAPPASTMPRRRLVVPMKSATNRVVGRSYSSSGVPSCSTLPWFMIAIRSLIVSASSWSWVT